MVPEFSLPHSQVPTTCRYPEPDQSNPCPMNSTSWRCILILSFHPYLGLSSGLLPSCSPSPHTHCMHHSSLPSLEATCRAHFTLDYPNDIWWQYRSRYLLLAFIFPPLPPKAHISPPPSALFSSTFSLCFSNWIELNSYCNLSNVLGSNW